MCVQSEVNSLAISAIMPDIIAVDSVLSALVIIMENSNLVSSENRKDVVELVYIFKLYIF